jgi:hypothetical protein
VAKRGRPSLNTLPSEPELPFLIELWNQALSSPFGIAISSNKPNALLQKLYRARRECGHVAYHDFKLVEFEDRVEIRLR